MDAAQLLLNHARGELVSITTVHAAETKATFEDNALAQPIDVLTAAFGGNVVGYEIGRRIGPPLYARDGRIIKRKHFDQTHEFFDRHGSTAWLSWR